MYVGTARGDTDSCSLASEAGGGQSCCNSAQEDAEMLVGARLSLRLSLFA